MDTYGKPTRNSDLKTEEFFSSSDTLNLLCTDANISEFSNQNEEWPKEAQRVLGKLLDLILTDSNNNVREDILKSLHRTLDRQLAQPRLLKALCIVLNDDSHSIRKEIVTILGRINRIQPMFVIPVINAAHSHLLDELQYASDIKNYLDAADLLAHLIRSVPVVARLKKDFIMHVIKVKLSNPEYKSMSMFAATLDIVTQLCLTVREAMLPEQDELLDVIARAILGNYPTSVQTSAIRALCSLVRGTGCIACTDQYPALLPQIISIIAKRSGTGALRTEALRAIGVLGAVDPSKFKELRIEAGRRNDEDISSSNSTNVRQKPWTWRYEEMQNITSEIDIAFIVTSSLMDTLDTVSMSLQQAVQAVQAITIIVRSLGLQCSPLLNRILPGILGILDQPASTEMRNRNDSSVGVVVSCAGSEILSQNYLHPLLSLMAKSWSLEKNNLGELSSEQTFEQTIGLAEDLAVTLKQKLSPFLSNLLPPLLQTLREGIFQISLGDENVETPLPVICAYSMSADTCQQFIVLVISSVVAIVESSNLPESLRVDAVVAVSRLNSSFDLSSCAARILHSFCRAIRETRTDSEPGLWGHLLYTLRNVVQSVSINYIGAIGMLRRVMSHITRERPHPWKFEKLVATAASQQRGWFDANGLSVDVAKRMRRRVEDSRVHYRALNEEQRTTELLAAWQSYPSSSKCSNSEWFNWHSRLALKQLELSPSLSLWVVHTLAEVVQFLAHRLFIPSFSIFWGSISKPEIKQSINDEIQRLVGKAVDEKLRVPSHVLQYILSIFEIIERDNIRNPRTNRNRRKLKGGSAAEEHNSWSLHTFKALEQLIGQLVAVNSQLGLQDAAKGALHRALEKFPTLKDSEVKNDWLETLGHWSTVLESYKRKEMRSEGRPCDLAMKQIQCFDKLRNWQQLFKHAKKYWNNFTNNEKEQVAPSFARAGLELRKWNWVQTCINIMPTGNKSAVKTFFELCLLAQQTDNNKRAKKLIQRARQEVEDELNPLLQDGYISGYMQIVKLQQIAEIEELFELRRVEQYRKAIHKLWTKRIKRSKYEVEVWQRLLVVPSLSNEKIGDEWAWIKFAAICLRQGRISLSESVLKSMMKRKTFSLRSSDKKYSGAVHFAWAKHLWKLDKCDEAVEEMNQLLINGVTDGHLKMSEWIQEVVPLDHRKKTGSRMLLSSPNLNSINATKRNESIHSNAIDLDNNCAKAWGAYALAHFRMAHRSYSNTSIHLKSLEKESVKNNSKNRKVTPPECTLNIVTNHVAPAMHGFFRAISLDKTASVLQKLLRLLTLWFAHGNDPAAHAEFVEGVSIIPEATWLGVIPQLIARIHSARKGDLGQLLQELLFRIGKVHPQALIFPLTVACKSPLDGRRHAANCVLQTVRRDSPQLVEEAFLVSNELIRVAILWHERWKRGIEEASELYFGSDSDIDAAIATLKPLHAMIEAGAQTASEIAFLQRFACLFSSLLLFFFYYENFIPNNFFYKQKQIHITWTVYYQTFHAINNEMIKRVKRVELRCASPRLLKARNLSLAVPGTYYAVSSRRPRKVIICGSDGRDRPFLLKGHEDLRQDERVMQLFGLVNEVLAGAERSGHVRFHHEIKFFFFFLIPLSVTTGVVGWVNECDTLQQIVRDFRKKRNVYVHLEMNLMREMTPKHLKYIFIIHDKLSLIQKLEVFSLALNQTSGQDLRKSMWLNSPDSEVWLDKRNQFTHSLALMSIVGYVLGLGDRHPSNIMIHRQSGKLVHIDFGDCWEVAQQREKYPEKIPFRLTRMLINAMEVAGIEGSFRATCEFVMGLLRSHRDSVMAMLEAFVHDPLINWRLVTDQPKSKKQKDNNEDTKNILPGTDGDGDNDETVDPAWQSIPGRKRSALSSDIHRKSIESANSTTDNVPLTEPCTGGDTENTSQNHHFPVNAEAIRVIRRVKDKLIGEDFLHRNDVLMFCTECISNLTYFFTTHNSYKNNNNSFDECDDESPLSVEKQVDKLIKQATSKDNLCQCYIGWCPFW
eukprot:GSMAST32.ASY1.ANO1.2280.1 assembled CDS